MVVSISVPDHYGYVVLSFVVLPMFTSGFMGNMVMKARKVCNVPYPNLYATPDYHKMADEFNRIQRGHQHMFEYMSGFIAMGLIGGLKHPATATAAGVMFSVGSYLYLLEYADTSLHASTARCKKGGLVYVVGVWTALGTTISMLGTMNKWW